MHHAFADGGVLDPAFFEYAAFAVLVCVPKFSLCAVGYDFVFAVGMKRPNCAG